MTATAPSEILFWSGKMLVLLCGGVGAVVLPGAFFSCFFSAADVLLSSLLTAVVVAVAMVVAVVLVGGGRE